LLFFWCKFVQKCEDENVSEKFSGRNGSFVESVPGRKDVDVVAGAAAGPGAHGRAPAASLGLVHAELEGVDVDVLLVPVADLMIQFLHVIYGQNLQWVSYKFGKIRFYSFSNLKF
jgi:hypothetical protein